MRRVVRWLFIGSICELLVAVGSHIVVRKRGDCSAPEADEVAAEEGNN
ncbi:MAG: hypothetical protein ACYTAN_18170 [Planctomycetota bacterium]|jgi:hypothetical protein